MTFHFWVFSVVTKLAPCILLTYLSLTLIKALIEADKRKKRLKSRPTPSITQPTLIQPPITVTQPTVISNTPPPSRIGQQSDEKTKDGRTEDGQLTDAQSAGSADVQPLTKKPTPAAQSNSIVTVVTGTNGTRTTYKSTLAVHSSIRERSSTSSGQFSGHSVQSTTDLRPQIEKVSKESSANDRTNRMLIAVLLLFLITEFPSGILVLLSGIIGDSFFEKVYSPLGELMDILALVNSSINFILYCTMSSIFRITFTNIFCKCFIRNNNNNSMVLNESTPIKSTLIKSTTIKVDTPNNNRKQVTSCVIDDGTLISATNTNCNQDQQQVITTF